jgi:hypothetical protein
MRRFAWRPICAFDKRFILALGQDALEKRLSVKSPSTAPFAGRRCILESKW